MHQHQAQSTTDLIRRMIVALNSHQVEGVIECHADSFKGTDVGQAQEVHGHIGLRNSITTYLTAFPDLEVYNTKVVEEGEHVAVFWSARGTHRGMIQKIPASGKRVEVSGVWLMQIHEGKIVESHTVWDTAGMLRGIGLLPQMR